MKINRGGVLFENYISASPNEHFSSFTDSDGATLIVKTTTLVRMYELVKFDLEHRKGWDGVMIRLEEECE